MFKPMSQETKRKLWKHQADALDFAIGHLNTWESPCLIRMPTATGKTGVIACLAMLSNQSTTLVLTPWAHLRDQMISDLEEGFWNTIGLTPKMLEVVPMFPSTAREILKSTESRIIVATFATLNDLRINHTDTYQNLAKAISLVIVDEGHYEPSIEWGKSVKHLNTKTLLLTATPYRNDLKLFRITDPEQSTHHFTHKQAVERAIIRELSIEALVSQSSTRNLSLAFAKKWESMKSTGNLPSQAPRSIICCSDATSIEEVVVLLRKAGLKAIGVHEQFKTSASKHLYKEVPKPKEVDADIWVHQHKLTEGLDDHRFCCVALFTQIRNDRKLIQQVGRILRRKANDLNKPAILLAPSEYSVEAEWNAYLEFETNLQLLEPQHFRNVVQNLLSTQPEVEYFEKRFRRRFSPTDLSKRPQVIIAPSVLVRKVGKDFSLDDYIEDCTDTLNLEDAVILGPDINAPCQKSATFALWVYASVHNSRFLLDSSLYEIKLETHCVVLADGFVFISDSRGNFPLEYLEEHTVNVSPEQLARYLDKSFRPTHVNVESSIPYDTVLRGADLRGHNLLSVPASLTDRVQICRSARGSSRDSGRRYVGMSKGRVRKEVSEEERRSFELSTFVSWAESVAKILNSTITSSALFHRYMPTCEPPSRPIPKTICIDLLRLNLNLSLADGRKCWLKKSSSDIEECAEDNRNIYQCSFNLEGDNVDDESVSLRIEYHPLKRRFWFNKQSGASVRVTPEGEDESLSKSLAEFLNQRQDIILVGLHGGDIVYQGRNFYKVDYSYAEKTLLGLIERPTNAPQCRTEKGTKEEINAAKKSKSTTFPDGSLFNAIANQLIGLPFTDKLLVCADLGTECADFIAANLEKHQLALIHAKAGGGRKISASAFHDIVAQAMKNLVYLTRSNETPKGVGSWQQNKTWNKTSISKLYRFPNDLPSGKRLWNKLKSDIVGSSDPELYVILVTTGCCDSEELKQAAHDPGKRTPEIAQLLHLLDGLNGYARQLGVKLIVRDLPYQSSQ
jgi:superfamily II DNA or RNA helicase